MARKKVSPLVQAMALFAQMDERDKNTLAEYVRTQTATPRKAPTKKAKKDAPLLQLKSDVNQALNGEEEEAAGPKCRVCGHPEDYQDHSGPSPFYHAFEPPAQPAVRRSRQKNATENSTANTEVEMVNATAVGATGD